MMNSAAWWIFPRFCYSDEASGSGGAPPSPPSGSEGPAAPSSEVPPAQGGGAAPQGSPPEPVGPEGGADPFAGMEDDLDSIDLGLPPEGGAPAGQQAPQPPAAQGQPVAEGKPPVPPQGQPQAPQAAPAGNVPQPPRSQLDTVLEGFKTNDKALSDWASTTLFSLTKEDAEALELNAVDAIPKLMGRVYSQAIQATTNLIKNLVPEMINSGVTSQNQRSARAAEALNQFYQANPHLNPTQHAASVDKWARAFRAANPSASRADAIAFVGRAVSAEHGIAPGAHAAAPQGGNGAARPVPFAPARPGGRAPQSNVPHDPYAGMEDDFEDR